MKLSVGIVGLPNVGKSTLFKALTKIDINIANYPFATIDPNVGIVTVPDERAEKLAELSKSKEKIPAVVEFYDIAGLVKGANKGEGLGNQFLNHIREVSVIVHVVRAFESADIIHVENSVDPVRDIEIVNTELALKDMEVLEKRIDRAARDAKTGDKEKKRELDLLESLKNQLDSGVLINTLDKDLLEEPVVKELGLLTSKPQLFLINGSESDVTDALKNQLKELKSEYIVADLAEGADIDELVRRAYSILGLISFFTTGEKETRAWTIVNGAKAPEAAGVIHTDFEEKFIRAEVINWEELLKAGGWNEAKGKGLIRIEGKEYVTKDGDVLIIRHS
ncbi:MAG: GTP-binding and nucleic acid-binding protein YchF [Parcubacteria group bacterium GW2011_GWB1_45_7]|uniref:Ribosome-binding ATPase YchF n=2 Tax=Candidatus Colwelliibacteriota TaxID=1817904 RepID=A0A1G1ZB46_9BACT|nr:MAG: GTP-binding and nucleic acid-binding protein YchF [Parcubacteria group bacterium GW2011_GWB1_45_7]OGY58561.1 MAG: redox-regulated ATPase YchF [Candidatus Colwellbacteria bacterium RIFCSPHIGHO2_02_FULL_45_17]OGY61648.1 MAG: redox-regulated ATPase YchF [Candidatus Colwellbacteria bacterium RIFCSPLOWO2_02_FULL_45_11]OGY61872.1 MAG: redox-regulated ATPase YchF [Candidatus Colwellbacteria bacterium RIFCSPLOWO2_12_FULL_46_17]